MAANFCKKCGNQLETGTQYCANCGEAVPADSTVIQPIKKTSQSPVGQSHKSPVVAFILCLFFGIFGFHRFYVGKLGTGLLMLITAGGLGFWFLVDLIFIVTNKFEDKQGNILQLTKNPSPAKKTMMVIGAMIAWFFIFVGLLFTLVLYLTSGLTYPVQSQLKSLGAGDIEKAYSYTSKDFQKATSINDFKKFLNQYPSLKTNESSFFNQREIQNNTGILKGTLTSKDGAKTPIEYRLIKEDGHWKILGIQVMPTGAGIEVNHHKDESSNAVSSYKNDLSNTYEDKPNQYSIKYPKDWSHDNQAKGTLLFRGQQGTPAYFTTVNIQTILTRKTGGEYSNVNALISALKKQLMEQTTNAKILDEGKVELPTNPQKIQGEYIIATYNYKQVAYKQMQFVVIRDDGLALYAWAYTAPVKLYDASLPIAKAMFESWIIY